MQSEQCMRQSNHSISSKVAYLVGVEEKRFWEDDKEGRVLFKEVFDHLEKQKPARIVRNLCILRSCIIKNWGKINLALKQGSLIENLPAELIQEGLFAALRADGIILSKERNLQGYQIRVNSLISDRINNCRPFFEEWLPWDYIKNLFIMPGGNDVERIREESQNFYDNYNDYPHHMYINFKGQGGSMFASDLVFLQLLYEQNGTEFKEGWRVSQITEGTRKRLYDFLNNAERAVILVDCENTNPFNLYAALADLEDRLLSVVSKIVLYNDVNTSIVWERVKDELSIPVEHIMTERILDHKSLVDTMLVVGACKEYYENNADSLIIVSSDSDYWGLISSLKDAKFLLLVEREQCSVRLRSALQEEDILYCFLEDFPSGKSDELRELSIYRELRARIDSNEGLKLNLKEIISNIIFDIRAESSEAWEDEIYKKIKRSLRIEVEDDGKISILFNER